MSLKCDPEVPIELREQHPEVTPAYHFNKTIIPF
ncbi:MmcQ/YjbR family DNA-binding protein [Bacteroidota bacterium]